MAGRILVVDDLSLNRTILKAKLTAAFFSVETASNGRDALDLIHTAPPDLLLLDYGLPDMTGIDICTALRADPRTRVLPIILFSASTERTHRLDALQAGADDF